MKKKNIIFIGLFCITASSYLYIKTSFYNPSDIKNAKNNVAAAEVLYEQNIQHLYDYLRSIGLNNFIQPIQVSLENIKTAKKTEEENLTLKLSTSERGALAQDKRTMRLYSILLNAKVLNLIDRLFDTLNNIWKNIENEKNDYAKNLAEILPKKIKLEKKISILEAELGTLKKEKAKLLQKVEPVLTKYYEKMKKSAQNLFDQTKRVGRQMSNKAEKELNLFSALQQKIKTLKKRRVPKSIIEKLEQTKLDHKKLLKKVAGETARVGEREMARYSAIVDFLDGLDLTSAVVLNGPNEIKRWELARDVLKIDPPQEIIKTEK